MSLSYKNKTFRTTAIAFLLCFCISIQPSFAKSGEIIDRSAWGADDTLVWGVITQYAPITNIKIVEFNTSDSTSLINVHDYLQGLYYYLSTRFNQDLPFNYLVGWDGSVYIGAKGGIGVTTNKNLSGNLVIGYLPNALGMTDEGKSSIVTLIQNLSKKTGIGLHNISAYADIFDTNEFKATDVSSSWNSVTSDIIGTLKGSIPDNSSTVSYSVSITGVSASPASDGNTNVTVSFTNNTSFPLYGRIYAGSDRPSMLYVQNVWISTSRSNASLIDSIDANQNGQMTFEIPQRISKGVYSIHLYNDVVKFSGDALSVTLSSDNAAPVIGIVKMDTSLSIKVANTPNGFLNVRTSPSLIAPIITKEKEGSAYIVQKTTTISNDVWYQIKYDGTNLGWIDGAYTKAS